METNEMDIEYHSKSAGLGRCSFTLRWMDSYHSGDPAGEFRDAMRGQVFFSGPRKFGHPRPEEAR